MGLTFNSVLVEEGIDPHHVRLLRHETRRHGRTPYALWRDDDVSFDDYQRIQKASRRAYFASPYWASFVVSPGGKTLFVGLYRVGTAACVPSGWIDPISGRTAETLADYDFYATERLQPLSEYSGKLVIGWGSGTRSWAQRAHRQAKPIIELQEHFVEPPFPGYLSFCAQLSDIEAMPMGWRTALAAVHGVYLLTCPRTREQYVGSASGAEGLLGRWLEYAQNGHGGNVALKSRNPEDYRVSVLYVAASTESRDSIERVEGLWKSKLQSREMGLNRN
ncbi:MAG TPA: GIY-YIG nuclease family protein [Sphingomonas sp.]|jgi:hypothetical protein|nr:GIY-YIG nuclease family protein [Sphingomonas sp.]